MNATGLMQQLRARVPAGWRRRFRRWTGRGIFVGDYGSWADARAHSRGYDDPSIFDRAVTAARSVRDGKAAWDRDTVLFFAPAGATPLSGILQRIAGAAEGRLNLVDLGGAFGSKWWQCRSQLAGCAAVQWSIVEQPHWVEAGRREFTVPPLRFFRTLDECDRELAPDTLLLSSVLPYVERPHDLLADARARRYRHVIIDRTGFVRRGRDRLTVQRVPPSIYPASYPCWFFAEDAVRRGFAAEWELMDEWLAADEADIDAVYRVLYFRRRG